MGLAARASWSEGFTRSQTVMSRACLTAAYLMAATGRGEETKNNNGRVD